MAKEAESSSKSSGAAADSYIGSLISLTSKSEIRYEGILYNINTDEASIGLRNVRSFGTEGRKKDGPQIPPSEKVYEYILFRGSDIKDLQVKSSPTLQTTPPLNNDPAIIQSHYPFSTSATGTSGGSGSLTDLNMHSSLLGAPGSNFQGGLPLYQPGGSLGSWSTSPSPPVNGAGLAVPMYWQGYYGPANGLPQMQQQSLLRPPPGLSMAPSMQQPMQYPNYNASLPTNASNLPSLNLPEAPSPLLPASSSSQNITAGPLTTALPSNVPTAASETLPTSTPNLGPIPSLPTVSLSASLPSLPPVTTTSSELSTVVLPISNKTNVTAGQPQLYQSSSQSRLSVVGESTSVPNETTTPSLVTPGQLMQSGSNPIASSLPLQTAHKDVEVVQVSSSMPSELTVPVATEAQPPILPLPAPSRSAQKLNGAPFQNRYGYRGHERGRGTESSRPVTKFTEDFDFEAMNEKFKKKEVWGHLCKSGKSHSNDRGNGRVSDEEDAQEEDDAEFEKIEVKPVYNKDDFFDTLSCNALDHDSRNGRTRFSEQLKIDTETFGDFTRHRGGRGGRWSNRGGRRGGYYGNYGRGYGYGYGYGYGGRGRGRGMPNRAP